ncbi:hypothetical protein DL769_003305 [Monosporascus sp. CRB-8-3]|nr:hypothetical protein DL769_003305 [Monosporascus sp. CRB-8-3]
MEFAGNALVVGGGGGIGRATCLAFAKAGVPGLVVADLDLDSAQKVATEAKTVATDNSFHVEAIHVDVTLQESVDNMVNHTARSFGRLDYCVICAGGEGMGTRGSPTNTHAKFGSPTGHPPF